MDAGPAMCGGVETPVYRVPSTPLRCCELIRDRALARACPRGPIALIRDVSTGLLQNRHFDPSTQVFDRNYEETQIFSPRFRAYVRETAARFSGRAERVVEPGCGKGDFLIALCQETGARGIGIDPSFRADRHADFGGADVAFLVEELSDDHAALAPDTIVCRHTLEHIGDLDGFLGRLRRLAEPASARLYVDVPDATRILAEGAFWDVYYEHCNYFTPASLARTLRRAGFQVDAIRREFDGQFLCADARLADGAPDADIPEDAPDLVDGFAARASGALAEWRRRVLAQPAGSVVLWGAGSKAVAFTAAMGDCPQLVAAIDVNPHKAGTFLPGSGLPVAGPEALATRRPESVILMNPAYREEVAALLTAHGSHAALAALGAPA